MKSNRRNKEQKKFPPIESIVYTDSFVDMRKDYGLVEATCPSTFVGYVFVHRDRTFTHCRIMAKPTGWLYLRPSPELLTNQFEYT